jgi:hypothetical protein
MHQKLNEKTVLKSKNDLKRPKIRLTAVLGPSKRSQ